MVVASVAPPSLEQPTIAPVPAADAGAAVGAGGTEADEISILELRVASLEAQVRALVAELERFREAAANP